MDNYASNTIVNGTSAADSIHNEGSRVTINAGDGNDTVYSTNGHYVLINGGDGKDTLNLISNNSTVNGGAGDDSISVVGISNTINGGTGDDYISAGGEHAYMYRNGDGNDTIVGYKSTDTIRITDGSNYSTVKSGSDVLVNIGSGSILLKNYSSTLNIVGGTYVDDGVTLNNSTSYKSVVGTSNNDSIYNSQARDVTIDVGDGNDSVYNYYGAAVSINGGNGNDTIYNSGASSTLLGGAGNDTITNYGARTKISAGDGADSVVNWSESVSMTGGAGNDTLYVHWQTTTVNGGTGNDYIYQSAGSNVIEYAAGAGNDSIEGYMVDDTIRITDGSSYSTQQSGADVIVRIGDGSILLKDYSSIVNIVGGTFVEDGLSINNYTANTVISGSVDDDTIHNEGSRVTINAGDGNDTVYSTNGHYVLINGGDGKDTLNLISNNSTVNGGAGDDSLSVVGISNTINGGTGDDYISAGGEHAYMYRNGDGNDTIVGYKSSDTIRITDGSNYSTVKSGSDVLVNIGSGSILLKNYSSTVNIVGGTESEVTLDNTDDDTLINGDAEDNTITNSGSFVTIDGGAGNDAIINYYYAWEAAINGGAGDDSITNYASSASINGGDGNDRIINSSAGSDSTIDGGAGNDFVSLGADSSSSNVIRYASGGGFDTVVGYKSSDLIIIDGGADYSTIVNGNDVIVSVGSGSITLKDAANQTININEYLTPNVGAAIYNANDNTVLTGTAYDDTVDNAGSRVNINLGDGNDTLINSGTLTTIGSSEGNDIIVGFGASDVIRLADGSKYSTQRSGSDVLVSLESGSIRLKNYSSAPNISGGTLVEKTVDAINNSSADVLIRGTSLNDTITNSARSVTINAGAGNDVINLDKNTTGSYRLLAGELKYVASITADNCSRLTDIIGLGIISSTNGTIAIPNKTWEDYDHEKLTDLSDVQVAEKISEFITELNDTYLKNRVNADGLAVTSDNTATISAEKLMSDYDAESGDTADVKAAMANNIDKLNEIFGNQELIRLELSRSSGTIIPTGKVYVSSVYDDDFYNGDNELQTYFEMGFDRPDGTNGAIETKYGYVDTDTSLGAAREVMANLIGDINSKLRSIECSIQFETDGSDLYEKYQELTELSLTDIQNDLRQPIDIYNYIKAKAFYMTAADQTVDNSGWMPYTTTTAVNSDVYDPFYATIDDYNDSEAKVAAVDDTYRQQHNSYEYDRNDNIGAIGYCNISDAKYRELAAVIDTSDSDTRVNYERYYQNARDLYNHLQATAFNSAFSTDGSDMLVIGDDDYKNLRELIPGKAEYGGNPQTSFVDEYASTAALTDYLYARRIQGAVEYESVGGDVIEYAAGDGNDTVYGFNSSNTIRITDDSKYTTQQSGADVLVSLESGSIRLKDYSSTPNISGGTPVEPANVINNSASNVVVTGTSSDDTITNSARSVTINAGKGNDVITFKKDSVDSSSYQLLAPNYTWEDYAREELADLSDVQVANKISEFITEINDTYLKNRVNADGLAVTSDNTATISAGELRTDYNAESGSNADVKVAMSNTVDKLNEIFGNQELIRLELSQSTGTIIPTDKVAVKSVHADDIANGETALQTYFEMGFDRLDSSWQQTNGALTTSYGTVDTDTSIGNARKVMAHLISDINAKIRSISLMPVDTYTTPLDSGKIYLSNMTATDTGAAEALAAIRSIQFALDGSDLYEKYQQVADMIDDNCSLHYSIYDPAYSSSPVWVDASPVVVLLGSIMNLRQPIDIYNYIKAKAFYMTAVDQTFDYSGATPSTNTCAVNSDVYDPFHATIDDCNISDAKYNEFVDAIDISDIKTRAKYDRYYNNARDLYNHLQATAFNSTFSTDGSDLLVIDDDEYKDLLELIPSDNQSNFISEYASTAALTDYLYARRIESAIEEATAGDENVIHYKSGDGNDTVYGFNSSNAIRITDSSKYATQQSGDDVLVSIGSGSIRLKDYSSTPDISGGTFVETAGVLNNSKSNVLITGTSLNDTITNSARNVTIEAGAGNDVITLEKNNSGDATNTSYQLLAGELKNVASITADNYSSVMEVIGLGVINSANGTIIIPSETWEDYDHDELANLSEAQIANKISEFITELNDTYLKNRVNADGKAVTATNTATISSGELMTDYSAESGDTADVKIAMANTVDKLNAIFGNQELIRIGLSNSTGTFIPTGKVAVKSVHDDDIANGDNELETYYEMGFDRLDSSGAPVSGALTTKYGTVDIGTSLDDARKVMAHLITDINKAIRSISLMPVDTTTTLLDQNKLYINLTATDTGAADVLATIRSIQFATDGSDLYEKYQQVAKLTDDTYLIHYGGVYDPTQPTNPIWGDASLDVVLLGPSINLRQPIDIYNFIKTKAFYMTAVDQTVDNSTAVNSDVCDPFYATIDDCNISYEKYNDLAAGIDASDSDTKANYDRYYNNARDLYNHLQATAFNSAFSTDGSDMLVIGDDDYKDLLELIPNDDQSNFISEYASTAALTDYLYARRIESAIEEATAGDENVIHYKSGDGNDTVNGFNSSDTIRITDGAAYSTQQSGADVLVSIGNGSILLKDYSSTPNISGGTPVDSTGVINNSTSNVVVAGTSLNDTITNSARNVTIDAGAGNDAITLGKNNSTGSYQLLAGEIENVVSITADNYSSLIALIEPGTINATNGTIAIPNETWEDYDHEELAELSDIQIANKISEFITELNDTYLKNRVNADGKAVTATNTATISAGELMTDYTAASGDNADVNIAMSKTVDRLNKIFGNQELIRLELSQSTGIIIPTGKVAVKSVHADDISNGNTVLQIYYEMGFDRLDSSGQQTNGALTTKYGTVDTGTSLGDARKIMANLITDINKKIRSISLMPVDTYTTPLDPGKIYLNLTATDTGAADALATLRSIQFSTDGSDLYEKYQQVAKMTDYLYDLNYSVYDPTQPTNPAWMTASPASILFGSIMNLRQPIDIYNFIKTKAFYMTAVDQTVDISGATPVTTTTAVNSDVYDPFRATIDDCNISNAKYNELIDAIDASDSKTKAKYDRYYNNARDLYNHLQATAFNSTFSTDGSDLLVIDSDKYKDLLELIPSDDRSNFIDEYSYTAALTDYLYARRIRSEVEDDSDVNENVIRYTAGDGNDTVYGFNSTDTIHIADKSEYSTQQSGDDVLVNIGNGSIRLKDYSSAVNIVGGTPSTPEPDPEPYFNPITNGADNVKVTGTEDADYIINTGENVTVQAGAGDDSIDGSDLYGELFLFSSADGNDTISNFGTNDSIRITAGSIQSSVAADNNLIINVKGAKYTGTITLPDIAAERVSIKGGLITYVGTGKDIINHANDTVIAGTDYDDYILTDGARVTVEGKGGDDLIESAGKEELFVFNAVDGNDTITGFGADDSIKIKSGTVQSITPRGEDHIVTVRDGNVEGTILLQNTADYNFTTLGGVIAVETVHTFRNYEDSVKVVGTSDEDIIINTGEHVSIEGKGGDDTITGSDAYGDMYLFSSADGNNIITNFGKGDSLKMTAGKTLTYDTDGDDVVVTLKGANYTGTVRLLDVADKQFTVKGGVMTRPDGATTIRNDLDNHKFVGTSDAEYMINTGEHVTIQPNGGDDTVEGSDAYGEMILLASNTGNNVITNFGDNDTIRITAGKFNSLATVGDDVIITVKGAAYSAVETLLCAASKQFTVSGSYISVVNGAPTITNDQNKVKFTGTSEAEWLINSGENVSIDGKGGGDTIEASNNPDWFLVSSAYGSGNVILGFDADDSIRCTAGKIQSVETIGNDVRVSLKGSAYSGDYLIKDAAGMNFVHSGSYVTVDAGAPTLDNTADNIKFVGTAKDEYMINYGEGVTVEAKGGSDTIEGSELYGEMFNFSSADGNNIITNFGKNDSLRMTAGQSLTFATVGSDVVVTLKGKSYTGVETLIGAAGLNFVKNGAYLTVEADAEPLFNGTDNVKFTGTEDADYMINTAQGVTIQSGGGNDTVEGSDFYGELFNFSSADGNNVITNFGVNDTLKMTAGSSLTWSTVGSDVLVTLKGAKFTGTVKLENAAGLNFKKSGSNLIVDNGAKVIINGKDNVKVSGTSGADWIENSGENVTIEAKGGNDTIVGSDFYGEQFNFSSADGNNLVIGFDENDTLKATAGSIQAVNKVGNDAVIDLKGAKYSGRVTLQGAAAHDFVQNGNVITVKHVNQVLNWRDGVKVVGTDGTDWITSTGEKVSIEGKGGNDTLTGSDIYGDVFLLSSAHGNNIITNFGYNDTLRATGGSINNWTTLGDDVIVTIKGATYTGVETLLGAAGLEFKKSGANLTVSNVNRIVNSKDKTKVAGTSGNDYIINSGEHVTIQANAGDDTVEGSDAYGEMFLFASNTGDNVITNFRSNDTLRCTAGSIASFETIGNDVFVSLKGSAYSGSVTLKDAAGLNFKKSGSYLTVDGGVNYINNYDNARKVVGTAGDDWIVNAGERVSIEGKGGNDTIEGSNFAETFLFSSADGNNVVTNFGVNDSLKMTAGQTLTFATVGADVVVTLKGKSYTGVETLQGAAGMNFKKSGTTLYVDMPSKIFNSTDGVKVSGTDGADYITNVGQNATIESKGGNDTIVGSDFYGETFNFSASDDDNVIVNFGANDTLRMTSGTSMTGARDGNNYVVTLKSQNETATVTLTDVGANTFRIGSDGKTLQMRNAISNGGSSVMMPAIEDYWFLDDESAADEINAIISADNLVALDEPTVLPTLNGSARIDQISALDARHQNKK